MSLVLDSSCGRSRLRNVTGVKPVFLNEASLLGEPDPRAQYEVCIIGLLALPFSS